MCDGTKLLFKLICNRWKGKAQVSRATGWGKQFPRDATASEWRRATSATRSFHSLACAQRSRCSVSASHCKMRLFDKVGWQLQSLRKLTKRVDHPTGSNTIRPLPPQAARKYGTQWFPPSGTGSCAYRDAHDSEGFNRPRNTFGFARVDPSATGLRSPVSPMRCLSVSSISEMQHSFPQQGVQMPTE